MGVFQKVFGTHSDREIKKIMPMVKAILALEEEYSRLSESELKGKTEVFRERLKNGEDLDDILVEAFATVREASWRVLGMKHFPVQLIGGIVLHQGRIAEMRTGEGKTLVATLPAYLNGLAQKGIHIVTVNDYLAKYHSEWMGKVYRYLGLTCGLIINGMNNTSRRAAYACDITYGTNNEMGFDYLRDNMATYKREMVQRGFNFAIVDEVDSILIDEARTPLIISGQGEAPTPYYELADKFVAKLTCARIKETDSKQHHEEITEDYIVDEKARTAILTSYGIAKAERAFNVENITDPENTTLMHHINQALKARGTMRRDVDYVVKDGQIIIVDEFTGRLMIGRRYSEGLHQAIEAKEHVKVERESKTLATITLQNYFRMYDKLSGMTGTAMTEETEFQQIYKLDVIEIPTNKPMIRIDNADVVYKTKDSKYRAVIEQVKKCHEKGQPVLVGTISIEVSEYLSSLLKRDGIPHVVLNAKHHEKEAEIVAQAGKLGAVTIATNMAGRGTDIMLGGNADFLAVADLRKTGISEELIVEATGYADTDNEEIIAARENYARLKDEYKRQTSAESQKVIAAGGLYIIGTERHESRRIDNQLRGRAARQGDPGESQFFIALEDDLMRLFGSERLTGMLSALGLKEDMPIDAKILSGAIENAQKKIESRNFEIRKHVLQYDDVMNKQREIIYGQRSRVLDEENISESIHGMIEDVIKKGVVQAVGNRDFVEQWQLDALKERFCPLFLKPETVVFPKDRLDFLNADYLTELVQAEADAAYKKREEELGPELIREVERVVLLRTVDEKWMDHIDMMDELRRGISLRAYGQNDPVIEYKREGFAMFDEMTEQIREETVARLFTVQVQKNEEVKRTQVAKPTVASSGDGTVKKAPVKKSNKIGRNDPCPCGSGKKYKKCCGFDQAAE